VRQVVERDDEQPWGAIGSRLAADLYGASVLEAAIQDGEDNETRFVWISRESPDPHAAGPWKTALVFWGAGTESAGWLVRCLAEFAERGVNLTRIESRPRRRGLGSYMFFVDLDGHADDPPVAEAIASLRDHAVTIRLLGSFPAAR
jgi:prephenate dehydratase